MIDPFRFSLICWFNWMNICMPWFVEALLPPCPARMHWLGTLLGEVAVERNAEAKRLMAEKARIISEGAGALALAAALSGKAGQGPIVAIVSGGNIDLKDYCDLIGNVQPR